MEEQLKTILTIAGFDPSSGAGVTADLAVIASHGFFGTSAVTALTVQSTLGVKASHLVDAAILAATLDCLVDDIPPSGIKIGMLASRENVRVVVQLLNRLRLLGIKVPVVLDPVMRSSSGRELLSLDGVAMIQSDLLPVVDWLTPNIDELATLTRMAVSTPDDVESAVASLLARYRGLSVVGKGGHLATADDFVAVGDGRKEWMLGTKIPSRSTHGTGCAFSTALVCGLVAGNDGLVAARSAKAFVTEAIRSAPVIGHGTGPMNLRWPLARRVEPPAEV